MTMTMHASQTDFGTAQDPLRALRSSSAWPDTEPGESLWPRIVAARSRQLTQRRQRKFVAGSAAMLAALLIAVWWPEATMSPLAEANRLVDWQQQSHELEREWSLLATTASVQASGFARLQGVDHALQRAYDRNAASDELATLWAQRSLTLRRLISKLRDPEAPVNI